MTSVEILKELEKHDDDLTAPVKKLLFLGKLQEAASLLVNLNSGDAIIEKFKHDMKSKSFYRNLKKILKEKSPDKLDIIKATSSLLTHLCIEATHSEQKEILNPYIEKVAKKLYNITEKDELDITFLKEFIN